MTRRGGGLRDGPYMELPEEAPCDMQDYTRRFGETLDDRS
jgi:hypothetical protein